MVLMDVMTEYAPLYRAARNAAAAETQMANHGVRWLPTRATKLAKGVPPSRAKA